MKQHLISSHWQYFVPFHWKKFPRMVLSYQLGFGLYFHSKKVRSPLRIYSVNATNFFYIYMDFFSRTFTIHRTAGEKGGYLFNSSLRLPLASQTLRHQPDDYCRELTVAHSQQPDSNREPLVSECKSLTTKLCYQTRIFL